MSIASGKSNPRKESDDGFDWVQSLSRGGSVDQGNKAHFVIDLELTPPPRSRPTLSKLELSTMRAASFISVDNFDESLDCIDNLERFSREGIKSKSKGDGIEKTQASKNALLKPCYIVQCAIYTLVIATAAVCIHAVVSKSREPIRTFQSTGKCKDTTGNPYLQCACGQEQVTGDYPEEVALRFMELRTHFGLSKDVSTNTGSCDNPYNLALWYLSMNTANMNALRMTNLYVLAILYHTLDGPSWDPQSDWMSLEVNECDWGGVTCAYESIMGTVEANVDGSVAHLNLDRLKLAGSLPSEIGLLTQLESLSLSTNSLFGKLPTEFLEMTNLRTLSLQKNAFVGTLPDPAKLSHLKVLALDHNAFTGTLPEKSLDKWSGLQELYLQYNSLTGTLPSSLLAMQQLEYLNVAHNKFTGSIPDVLELGGLKWLLASDNQLTGSLNEYLPAHLEALDLSRNMFAGTLPHYYGSLGKLRILNLELNENITGTLPSEYGSLEKLDKLVLHSCQLTGSVPSELGNLQVASILDLRANKFEGEIPSEICALGTFGFLEQLSVNCGVGCTCCVDPCEGNDAT